MTKAIRLGLIGCGKWGANYLKTIEKIDGVEIGLIACKSMNNKRNLKNVYYLTDNWHDVVNSSNIDGIIIATPPNMHYKIASEAIKNGKPTIVEKPLTLNAREANNLFSLSLVNRVNVRVNHVYLYHPMYRFFKKYIGNFDNLKSICSLSGNYGPFRENISSLWDWAPHDIAMCLDVLGEMPININAKFSKQEFDKDNKYDMSNISMHLRFNNDVDAYINTGNIMECKKRYFKLNFEKKAYIFDPISSFYIQEEVNSKVKEIKLHNGFDFKESPLEILLKDFLKDINSRKFQVEDLKLSKNVIKIIESIDDKLRIN